MHDAQIEGNPRAIVLLVENLAIGQENVLALRLAIRKRASIVVKLAIWQKSAKVPRVIVVPEVVTIEMRDLAAAMIFVITLQITAIVFLLETITTGEEEDMMIIVVVPQVIETIIGVMVREMVREMVMQTDILTMAILLMGVVDRDLQVGVMVDVPDLFLLLDDEMFLQFASIGRLFVVEVLLESVLPVQVTQVEVQALLEVVAL